MIAELIYIVLSTLTNKNNCKHCTMFLLYSMYRTLFTDRLHYNYGWWSSILTCCLRQDEYYPQNENDGSCIHHKYNFEMCHSGKQQQNKGKK